MSTDTVPISPSSLPSPRTAFSWESRVPPLRRFSSDDYQRMLRNGIIN